MSLVIGKPRTNDDNDPLFPGFVSDVDTTIHSAYVYEALTLIRSPKQKRVSAGSWTHHQSSPVVKVCL